jgi:hypothetical protein
MQQNQISYGLGKVARLSDHDEIRVLDYDEQQEIERLKVDIKIAK